MREGARHVARLIELGGRLPSGTAPRACDSELLDAIGTAGDGAVDYAESCSYAGLGEEQSVLSDVRPCAASQ